MAVSEAGPSRRLGTADVAGGLALSTASGWNQTTEDWALFIGHGTVFGRADGAGTLIATAAALAYGKQLGWISMVLVNQAWRRQGLATGLMDQCVQALETRGATPLLDATPAGAMVYRRIGFHEGFAFTRWERTADRPTRACGPASGVRAARADELDVLCALDRETCGLERAFLIQDIFERAGTQALLLDDGSGFILARAGVRAVQIGPLAARSDVGALALLDAALARAKGAVFMDVPDRQSGFVQALATRGFSVQRPYVRMAKAQEAMPMRANAWQYALVGPEFG